MNSFWCLRTVEEPPGKTQTQLQQLRPDQLSPGEVTIGVEFSSLNYKDALAVTGRGRILKNFPLNAGIDAAGVVLSSIDPRFNPGQKVLINGMGFGETRDGGFSQVVRAPADFVVPLPEGLSTREAMALGTAGFTAALALHRMQQNGQVPSMGPILVTGASGGVGSIAIQLFQQAGYEVHAVSGKTEATTYLRKLGAKKVLRPDELALGTRPLETVRYGGALDNVGGKLLSNLLAHIQLWGTVASVGLAESAELNTTVMPFILRGVSLLGVSSANCAMELRKKLWYDLGNSIKPKHLDEIISRTISLKDVPLAAHQLLDRKVQGRLLIQMDPWELQS